MHEATERLLDCKRLYSREEVLRRPNPVPRSQGLYVWFFRDLPGEAPVVNARKREGCALLYTGISPATQGSRNNLRNRIRSHYSSNASASTLRFTLGCLLSERLGLVLRRVGRTSRLHFADKESILSDWMAGNAFVCWIEWSNPWEVEPFVIRDLRPPLNIRDNSENQSGVTLSNLRSIASDKAKELPKVL